MKDPYLCSIKGMALLDNDGERIISRYFNKAFENEREEIAFEKKLFAKTKKSNAEIIMLDGFVVVYRSNVDLFFYVMGDPDENELVLVNVLTCLFESVSQVLRKSVEKFAVLENLDLVFLIFDEICHEGIVLECDSSAVVSRVALRGEADLSFGDKTIADVGMKVWSSAKEMKLSNFLK